MKLSTILIGGAAFVGGIYVGIQIAKAHAIAKVSGGAKDILERIGINPKSSYGQAAGTIVDTIVGGAVN